MFSATLSLLFCAFITNSLSHELTAVKILSFVDQRFHCSDSHCQAYASSRASSIYQCQTTCLAYQRCRLANFERNGTCELFDDAIDYGGHVISDGNTTLMVITLRTCSPTGESQVECFALVNQSDCQFQKQQRV